MDAANQTELPQTWRHGRISCPKVLTWTITFRRAGANSPLLELMGDPSADCSFSPATLGFSKAWEISMSLWSWPSGSCARKRLCGEQRGLLPLRSRSEEHTSELQSHVNLVCR